MGALSYFGLFLGVYQTMSIRPSLRGPGYECEPAFPQKSQDLTAANVIEFRDSEYEFDDREDLSLDTLLLCNKTSKGPGFVKTEIQALSTKTIRLGNGECDEFKEEGFSCIEHYKCAGDDLRLITDGASQTRVVSIITKVSVEQEGPGFSTKYGFSIVDATDRKCKTYSKVCCGPRRRGREMSSTTAAPTTTTTETTTSKSTTIRTTPTTTTTLRTTTTKTSFKKPCKSKLGTSVADVSTLVLYGAEPEDEDCIENPDAERIPNSIEESNPCKSGRLSVADVVVPYSTFGNCTVKDDYQPQCGRHNEDGFNLKMVNMDPTKHESQFGEWPNMCALLKRLVVSDYPVTVYGGGASLITPRFVLTAAHILYDKVDYQIRCGDWDTQGTDEQFPYQERDVEEIMMHPDFDISIPVSESNFKNDVAVLKVKQPFNLAPHIDTICLPPPNSNYDGRKCAATGWGKNRFGSRGEYQTIMKEIWIDVIDPDTCQEALRKTRLGRFFVLDKESFICAGGESDKDMCTGDGGSPLMCPNNDGSFVQAGIVAWGIGCGTDGIPAGYVNVASYTCWIKMVIENQGGSGLPFEEECSGQLNCDETKCFLVRK